MVARCESMASGPPAGAPVPVRPAHQVALGRAIFFEATLSTNRNQSCASCHAAEAGWAGPASAVNAAGAECQGSAPGRFGNRKPPSAVYAAAEVVRRVCAGPTGARFRLNQGPHVHQERLGLSSSAAAGR